MCLKPCLFRLSVTFCLAVFGCSSSGGGDTYGPDEGEAESEGEMPEMADFSAAVVVDDTTPALNTRVAISDSGRVAVAYQFPAAPSQTITCADGVSTRSTFTIRIAVEDGAGGWATTDIENTGDNVGLDIVYDGDDLVVVYPGGPVGMFYCGPTDLVVARQSAGFAPTPIVDNSAEAPCSVPYCDSGDVVGSWPAAEFNGGDLIVAYQDTHFNFNRDDWERSDLEFYSGGTPEAIEVSNGSGYYNGMAVGSSGDLAIAYYNGRGNAVENLDGAWLAVFSGGAWVSAKILDVEVDFNAPMAAAFDGAGTPMAAFHDVDDNDLVVAWPSDTASGGCEDGYSCERVDRRHNVGQYLDMASDSDRIAISYYFCGESADCDNDHDALRWATRSASGGTWVVQDVAYGGETETCGLHTAIAFRPDGRAVIAYQCYDMATPSGRTMLISEN